MTRNTGDYGVWKNVQGEIDRRNYIGSKALDDVVFPENSHYEGDLVFIDNPSAKFKFYRWFKEYEEELDDLYDKGYERVIVRSKDVPHGKWKLNRPSWRVLPDGSIERKRHVLFACPAALVDQREEEERRRIDMLVNGAATQGDERVFGAIGDDPHVEAFSEVRSEDGVKARNSSKKK